MISSGSLFHLSAILTQNENFLSSVLLANFGTSLHSFFSIPGQILLSADFLPAAPSIYKAPEAASRKTSHANLEVQRPVLGRHLPSNVADPNPVSRIRMFLDASGSRYRHRSQRYGYDIADPYQNGTDPPHIQLLCKSALDVMIFSIW